MRPVPTASACDCDQRRARLAQYICPACHQAMVDLGPPAKWTICERCRYRIVPVQADRENSIELDGNAEVRVLGSPRPLSKFTGG